MTALFAAAICTMARRPLKLGRIVMSQLKRLAKWLYETVMCLPEWKREAQKQDRFSSSAYCQLRRGGWYPGRTVAVPDSVRWHTAAYAIAEEFGGLSAGWNDPKARGHAEVDVDSVPTWNDELRQRGLCVIGAVWDICPLCVSLSGIVYVVDNRVLLRPYAKSFDSALESFLSGIAPGVDDIGGVEDINLVATPKNFF